MKKVVVSLLFLTIVAIIARYIFTPYQTFEMVTYPENSHYLFQGTTYAEYLADARKRVARAKADPRFNKQIQEQITNYNSPFELEPSPSEKVNGKYKKAVILVHGLWDSPFYFRDVAPYFQKKGFLVRTVLMPGHGTNPVDELDTSYEEWIKAAKGVYEMTARDANEIYMGGFSTGALVSQRLLLDKYDIKGLFFFSPGWNTTNPAAALTPVLKNFYPFLAHRAVAFHRYGSVASNAVAQYHRLFKSVENDMEDMKQPLQVPLFVALTLDDTTIKQDKTLEALNKFYQGPKKIVVFKELNAPQQVDGSIIYINSYRNKILGLSHVSIPISPKNDYLGANSNFIDVTPYLPTFMSILMSSDSQLRIKSIMKGNYVQGSRTAENMKKTENLLDINYNPFFDEMIVQMNDFIDTLKQ